MNRKIKFGGMSISGKFVYGNLSILNKKFKSIDAGMYISNKAGNPFAFQIRPETVGQFTGLYDKNARGIYEGDIILIMATPGGGGGVHAIKCSKGAFYAGEKLLSVFDSRDIKIIGNIYENPEFRK